MLKLQNLTMKNFLSIGNVIQTLNFIESDLMLVLGENLDTGGNDNKNGSGKTTLVNALSYVLYGKPLVNIKFDNLINKSNMKNMFVTLSFELHGVSYRIERGRRPGIFRFFKDGIENESTDDEAQGENKHTQMEIERIIGISYDMFKHIVALNTYVEPFLSMGSNQQRVIIEQLLGITKLSEKGDKLKDVVKEIKDGIKEEEFRISATLETNKRIESNINSLKIKSSAWDSSKVKKISDLKNSIKSLLGVNINDEIELHKSKKESNDINTEFKSLSKELLGLDTDIKDYEKTLSKLDKLVQGGISEKICPTCNQEMDKETHKQVHEQHLLDRNSAKDRLESKLNKKNEVSELANIISSSIRILPDTYYKTIDEAYNHKSSLESLENKLSSEEKTENPFIEQIELLKQDGLQLVDYTSLNDLAKLRDHQEFLLKLLTNKDSFIRKKIIDQNLSFLNFRLAYYLSEIGLPHSVKFKSDLEVEIAMYGKEFDFDNLSRGERTRLILSLSWAFRDVFESMNCNINLLFIDELIDNGLDSSGTENVLKILKSMSRTSDRNIFLISHRDEFVSRIPNILKVTKEGGFTNIEVITGTSN